MEIDLVSRNRVNDNVIAWTAQYLINCWNVKHEKRKGKVGLRH